MKNDAATREEIEKSLQKRFRKDITSRFTKALTDYELLSPGDNVAVCISGGKDSMLMAKLFQEVSRRDKFPFGLVFLCMDPGYSAPVLDLIHSNARLLGIPLTIFKSDIFNAVDNITQSPCYLCARMRRGHLYSKAKELGCNKIALAHHYDDVIETTLMSMIYSGQIQTMMPKLHSMNFDGMELIRPMYLIREEDVIKWRDANGLEFIRCACHFTEMLAREMKETGGTDTSETGNSAPPKQPAVGGDTGSKQMIATGDTGSNQMIATGDTGAKQMIATGDTSSKRLEAKRLIAELKKTNPNIEGNIFKSMENIHLDAALGWKQGGVRHRFLDDYDSQNCPL